MEIGKLPNSLLEKIVLDPINNNFVDRKEVILRPSVGEDCAVVDFGGKYCLISTDPITGAVEDIGRLAVYINTNDIASSGGEPVGIMITALLPPTITEDEIAQIIRDVYTAAKEINISVLGGHTEITDAVVKPVLSCTVLGKCDKVIASGGAKLGDTLVMTKYAALEGTAIIANDKADKLSVSEAVIEKARDFANCLSVTKEGKICADFGVHAMHDVTEGGILGACYELAVCSNKGVEVDCDLIPVLPETAEICKCVNINPLRLISSGSMLIATDKPNELITVLQNEDIKATAIGKITEKGYFMFKDGQRQTLEEPDVDELYSV